MDYKNREYHNLHYALRQKHGKANRCDFTDTCTGKSTHYEWALKHGHEVSDNPEDYHQLCKSCHSKYDHNGNTNITPEHRQKLREAMTGTTPPNKMSEVKIRQIKHLHLVGTSNREIARILNITHPTVAKYLQDVD